MSSTRHRATDAHACRSGGHDDPPARTWRSAAVGIALTAVVLCHPALLGQVPGGHLAGSPPFGGIEPTNGSRLQLDIEVVLLPFLCHAQRELAAGRIPLWNPYSACGVPFLANQQSAVFHPFTLAAILFPWRTALLPLVLFRLLLAFTGCWLLASELRIGVAGRLLASISFALSGFSVTWICFPVGGVLLHLPAVIAFALRHSRTGRQADGITLFLLLASAILAGHFEYVPPLFAAGLAASLIASIVAGARAGCSRFRLLAPYVAAPLLCALVLLPSLEYLDFSHSFGSPHDSSGLLPSLRVLFSTLVFPVAFHTKATGFSPNDLLALILPSTSYVGILAIALAPPALASRPGRRVALLTLVPFLVMFRNPLSLLVWSAFPFRLMKPDKIAVFTALGLSLIAGFGWDRLRKNLRLLRTSAIAAPLVFFGIHSRLAAPDKRLEAVGGAILVLLLAALLRRSPMAGLMPLVVVGGLLGARHAALGRVLPWQRPELIYPAIASLDRLGRTLGHDRLTAEGEILFPDSALVYRLRDRRNYDGLRTGHAPIKEALVPARATRTSACRLLLLALNRDQPKARLTRPAAARLPGCRAIWDRGALPRAHLERHPHRTDLVRYVSDVPGDTRLHVDSPGQGRLVLRDTFFPGWRAALDGKPISIRALGQFRSVEIPAGRHLIAMRYLPLSYRLGLFCSLLTLVALAVFVTWQSVISMPQHTTSLRSASRVTGPDDQ